MILRPSFHLSLCRNRASIDSGAEIHYFLRARSHGINSRVSTWKGLRGFTSAGARRQIEPTDSQRRALSAFKKTLDKTLGLSKSARMRKVKNLDLGSTMNLSGYLSSRREVSKNLTFAVLRDRAQKVCIQLVSTPKSGSHEILKSLKEWTPILVKGTIKERKAANDATYMGMEMINDREIEVDKIVILNDVPGDIVLKEETVFPPEQRHLSLRTNPEARELLWFRHDITRFSRGVLNRWGFVEVETPILFKSTPEGAREFLVPTRDKGLAYALPQSPQQYKQMLMASGVPKYFQFARCFRDEDLRADRQPEFTQLDIEIAFGDASQVMWTIESLLRDIGLQPNVQPFLGQDGWITESVPRMRYQEAMATYGSDKPDLRLGMKISNITDKIPADLFSKISDLKNPAVDAFKFNVSDDPQVTRKFISTFLDSPEGKPFMENPAGQPGVFVSDMSKPQQGLGVLGHEFVMDMPENLHVDNGGLIILQARKTEPFYGGSTPIGNLRLALHKAAVAQGLIPAPQGFKFVWITDFLLFTPSNDTDPGQGGGAGLSATHHPFTAPKTAEDVELLLTAPEKAVAAHYDIVVNGVELGGGSCRIHNAEVQEFIFRNVLKMKDERVEDFRHLLDVLRSGCPPHAGIALGWDRLLAVMAGKESVRDVIAFPKSGRGEDPLVKSPNRPTAEQWETYHLQLKV